MSLTAFFEVIKGKKDIRIVYNGTMWRLNNIMWVPCFTMSTINTHLLSMEEGTWLGDGYSVMRCVSLVVVVDRYGFLLTLLSPAEAWLSRSASAIGWPLWIPCKIEQIEPQQTLHLLCVYVCVGVGMWMLGCFCECSRFFHLVTTRASKSHRQQQNEICLWIRFKPRAESSEQRNVWKSQVAAHAL